MFQVDSVATTSVSSQRVEGRKNPDVVMLYFNCSMYMLGSVVFTRT